MCRRAWRPRLSSLWRSVRFGLTDVESTAKYAGLDVHQATLPPDADCPCRRSGRSHGPTPSRPTFTGPVPCAGRLRGTGSAQSGSYSGQPCPASACLCSRSPERQHTPWPPVGLRAGGSSDTRALQEPASLRRPSCAVHHRSVRGSLPKCGVPDPPQPPRAVPPGQLRTTLAQGVAGCLGASPSSDCGVNRRPHRLRGRASRVGPSSPDHKCSTSWLLTPSGASRSE